MTRAAESRSVADATWPDIGARTGGVLVVPLGSTEQHGHHLPLSTDTDIACALATSPAAPAGSSSPTWSRT